MRITEHLYQISGSCYGTNSSTYVFDAGEELILFDAGYTDKQLGIMQKNLRRWGLEDKPITHLFLTHAHMDHAGNAHLFQKQGAKLYVGEADAQILAKGGLVTLDVLFGREFICCEADVIAHDGDSWQFGDATVQAVALPGHTAGSMGYIIRADGITAMATGDFVALSLAAPDESAQDILLSAMIKPGFEEQAYGESLLRAAELELDMLLPGHLITYEGDTKAIFRAAAKKYAEEPHQIMDLTAGN